MCQSNCMYVHTCSCIACTNVLCILIVGCELGVSICTWRVVRCFVSNVWVIVQLCHMFNSYEVHCLYMLLSCEVHFVSNVVRRSSLYGSHDIGKIHGVITLQVGNSKNVSYFTMRCWIMWIFVSLWVQRQLFIVYLRVYWRAFKPSNLLVLAKLVGNMRLCRKHVFV